jgi:hypothetical protein
MSDNKKKVRGEFLRVKDPAGDGESPEKFSTASSFA